jgi:hypothetical protein
MAVTPNVPEGVAAVRETSGPAMVSAGRLNSVDLLRGLVMAIMALDHTRDYFSNLTFQPEDLSHTYGALFFTRWITHFCAPAFFFLAGTGAFLSKKRGAELSSFLWKRGLFLVLMELTLIHFAWTFQLQPGLGFLVIWALGWAMVALALLVRLRADQASPVRIFRLVRSGSMDWSDGCRVRIWNATSKACCGASEDFIDAGWRDDDLLCHPARHKYLRESADWIWIRISGPVRSSEDDRADHYLVLQCGEIPALTTVPADDLGPFYHAAGVV